MKIYATFLTLVLAALVSVSIAGRAQAAGEITYTMNFVMVNGTTMKIEVDGNTYKAMNQGAMVNALLSAPAWVLNLEDRTIVIPTANVLYVECKPPMAAKPSNVISGRLIQPLQ